MLYGRQYCHLCHDMLAALEALHARQGGDLLFEVTVVDVDQHPELEGIYDERVPVLEAEGRELCHYFLDEAKVREYLGRFG